MKYLLAAAITAIALYGAIPSAMAHHSTQHSQGTCGLTPCPPTGGK
jgi:hypothetical protein